MAQSTLTKCAHRPDEIDPEDIYATQIDAHTVALYHSKDDGWLENIPV